MIKLMNIMRKLVEDITIPVKKGDTILVGRFRNHPIEVKEIGKDQHGMPTINGRPVVTFRLQKKEKKSLKETPVFKDGKGTYDLHFEKYPLNDVEKQKLIQAYGTDAGIFGYSKKYDKTVTFKRTGTHMLPIHAISISSPMSDAPPATVDTDMPHNYNLRLPEYWEDFVEGDY